MKTQLSFEIFDDYLKIHLSGEISYDEISDLLVTIKKLAEENNRTRILVDAMNVSNTNMPVMEKFHVGELSVDIFGYKNKIALVSKPEHINKFMETVAVNRGVRLYVVGNEQDALRWLLN